MQIANYDDEVRMLRAALIDLKQHVSIDGQQIIRLALDGEYTQDMRPELSCKIFESDFNTGSTYTVKIDPAEADKITAQACKDLVDAVKSDRDLWGKGWKKDLKALEML